MQQEKAASEGEASDVVRSMTAEEIAHFEQALAAWGGEYESETYEGASHGWTVPDNRAFNAAQTERAFAKLTELFAETLR